MLHLLLFIIVLEALPQDMRTRCPGELLYSDDLAFFNESIEGLKEKQDASENGIRSTGLRVNEA